MGPAHLFTGSSRGRHYVRDVHFHSLRRRSAAGAGIRQTRFFTSQERLMPTLSLPPRAHVTDVPRPTGTDHPARSLALRAHVATHRRSLTIAISEGAAPAPAPAR